MAFLFPFSGNDCELGEEFINNPDQFLQDRNMTYDDLECPQECHDALDRAEGLKEDLENFGKVEDSDDVQAVHDLAKDHFGPEVNVQYTPFGLRFEENITVEPNAEATATASASLTFLDGDIDADG